MLARWWRLAVFMKATNLLHRAMCAVLYRRIAMAIEMASKVGTCCIVVSFAFCCCPGGCRGNTEQVFAQWRHPVASGEALVMLHREMRSVWHWRTAMAIKMTHDGGAFVRLCLLLRLL